MTDPINADAAAIRQAALDYAEGWYTADAGRMQRALHPGLAKRTLRHDNQTGAATLVHLTQEAMVRATAEGGGSKTVTAPAVCTVTILDICGEIASACVHSPEYVDYLHLARSQGRWQIVNVLWADRP